jgi:hypothetical protein
MGRQEIGSAHHPRQSLAAPGAFARTVALPGAVARTVAVEAIGEVTNRLLDGWSLRDGTPRETASPKTYTASGTGSDPRSGREA